MRRLQSALFRRACQVALAGGLALLCGACSAFKSGGGGVEDEAAVTEEERKGFDKYLIDTKNPEVVSYGEGGAVTGGKRSHYEGKNQIAYGGEWDGKRYEKQEYEKTWWGGKKKKPMKAYAGNQDGSRFQVESLMMGKTANQAGKRSTFDGRGIASTKYTTGNARETGVNDIARTSDARTDWRRDAFPRPRIRGYKQQQQLEIEETRRLLGRD